MWLTFISNSMFLFLDLAIVGVDGSHLKTKQKHPRQIILQNGAASQSITVCKPSYLLRESYIVSASDN